MKNIAKLLIFFTLTFVVFFIAAIFVNFVNFWIDTARTTTASARLDDILVKAIWISISAAIYFSILFTLSYSARRHIPVLITLLCIVTLAFAFTTGVSFGVKHMEALQPALRPVPQLHSGPGLILTRLENTIILLRDSSDIRGPRLVSIPGQPLIYQERPLGPNNTVISLPPLPFGNETPWFIHSIGIDFSISATTLKTRFDESFFLFVTYALSLILLLSSLRFLLELSNWPLANIFLGALIFRLILSLEIFINSSEINTLLHSFLSERVQNTLITPLLFCAASILIMLYTLLVSIARSDGPRSRRKKRDA